MIKQRSQIPHGKNGNLRLVLTEDVQFLGKQGDVVEVRPGYGRNYLLPRGMATVPTAHNLQLLDRFKIRVRQAREARIADLKALAEQIQKMAGVTVESLANDLGHLFGSVGPAEVSKAMRSKNLPIDAEMVQMDSHIKEVGLYAVKVNLGHEIETEVKVVVLKAQEKK